MQLPALPLERMFWDARPLLTMIARDSLEATYRRTVHTRAWLLWSRRFGLHTVTRQPLQLLPFDAAAQEAPSMTALLQHMKH
jgi:hypothetical protein